LAPKTRTKRSKLTLESDLTHNALPGVTIPAGTILDIKVTEAARQTAQGLFWAVVKREAKVPDVFLPPDMLAMKIEL
jgi:hypothetical protein